MSDQLWKSFDLFLNEASNAHRMAGAMLPVQHKAELVNDGARLAAKNRLKPEGGRLTKNKDQDQKNEPNDQYNAGAVRPDVLVDSNGFVKPPPSARSLPPPIGARLAIGHLEKEFKSKPKEIEI